MNDFTLKLEKPLETLARAPLMQVLDRFHIDMKELVQYVLLHEDSSVFCKTY